MLPSCFDFICHNSSVSRNSDHGVLNHDTIRVGGLIISCIFLLAVMLQIALRLNQGFSWILWLQCGKTSCNITLVISNLMHKILIYLYITYLLKSSTYFEHYPAHLQEVYVLIVYMQPLVSSLSAGDCLVHRVRKLSFITGAQDSHLQKVTIPEAAYIQLRRRPPEDEQSNARNM
jgi:hypothetical protein